MTVVSAVVAVSVVVFALLLIVALLAAQLWRLRREVEQIRQIAKHPVETPIESRDQAQALAERIPGRPTDHDLDDVRVITALSDQEQEPDLTTARVASVTLGGPLIKVAALSHGVRRALREEQRLRVAHAFRKELRRQRKLRRRQRVDQAGSQGWRP